MTCCSLLIYSAMHQSTYPDTHTHTHARARAIKKQTPWHPFLLFLLYMIVMDRISGGAMTDWWWHCSIISITACIVQCITHDTHKQTNLHRCISTLSKLHSFPQFWEKPWEKWRVGDYSNDNEWGLQAFTFTFPALPIEGAWWKMGCLSSSC